MPEVVNAHFKAVLREPRTEFRWNCVRAFGNEIERRAKAEAHLQFRHLPDPIQSHLRFDIVREHEGELFAVGPPRPCGGRAFRAREDRPDLAHTLALPYRETTSNSAANARRKEWFRQVVEMRGRTHQRRSECLLGDMPVQETAGRPCEQPRHPLEKHGTQGRRPGRESENATTPGFKAIIMHPVLPGSPSQLEASESVMMGRGATEIQAREFASVKGADCLPKQKVAGPKLLIALIRSTELIQYDAAKEEEHGPGDHASSITGEGDDTVLSREYFAMDGPEEGDWLRRNPLTVASPAMELIEIQRFLEGGGECYLKFGRVRPCESPGGMPV